MMPFTGSLRFIALTCSLLPLGSTLLAQDEPPAARPWQMIVQLDNDVMAGSDEGYTNGSRFAFLKEFENPDMIDSLLGRSLYALSGADPDAPLRRWRYRGQDAPRFAWGVGLTQLMFTPEDPDAKIAPDGERPYAGWLGLDFSLHVKDNESVTSVTLSLGTTGGNSFAEDTQQWVHEKIFNSPVFQGWESAVPGEFTGNLHFDQKIRVGFLDRTSDWPIEFDGYYEWGAAVGNFRTDAYAGGLVRFGYNLPSTFSTPRVQLGSYGHEFFRGRDDAVSPFSLLGFAGLRGSAVLHDISLDGPVFRDFSTGTSSEPFVGEFLVGLGVRYRHFELALSRTFRTDEFTDQKENHTFGSVMLRFSLPF